MVVEYSDSLIVRLKPFKFTQLFVYSIYPQLDVEDIFRISGLALCGRMLLESTVILVFLAVLLLDLVIKGFRFPLA